MTLVSPDQRPPSTPYEAELRERIARAERQADVYRRLAAAQDQVIAAARRFVESVANSAGARELLAEADALVLPAPGAAGLTAALAALDRMAGEILIDSMPSELREALTQNMGAVEEALKGQDGPLFPGMFGIGAGTLKETVGVVEGQPPQRIAIVAHQVAPAGEESWDFDFADTVPDAFDKMRHWNERAAREWPGMRFTMRAVAPEPER